MNYKRHKPKEKQISWGSPKEYQIQRYNINSAPAKKPSWYCKKLKGKHDYHYRGTHGMGGLNFHFVWENYECQGCGKQKTKHLN